MKKFTLSRVLDGFRSSASQGSGQGGPVSGPSKNQEGPLTEIIETLRPDNFQISQVRYNLTNKLETFSLFFSLLMFSQHLRLDFIPFLRGSKLQRLYRLFIASCIVLQKDVLESCRKGASNLS